jgi:hypothetical protein
VNNYSRLYGGLICFGILLIGLVFVAGILYQSYWAVAIPVALGFLTILGLGFWVGWTIMTIRIESPTPTSIADSDEVKEMGGNEDIAP